MIDAGKDHHAGLTENRRNLLTQVAAVRAARAAAARVRWDRQLEYQTT